MYKLKYDVTQKNKCNNCKGWKHKKSVLGKVKKPILELYCYDGLCVM